MQSSIKAETAAKFGFHKVGEEFRRSVLYGGVVTPPRMFSKYEVHVNSLDGRVKKMLTLVDEPRICGSIPRVPIGPWINQLQEKNIWFNDFRSDSEEIEILVGNDHYQQLLTRRRITLTCGLTAVETVFGWTLNGRVPEDAMQFQDVNSARLMVSMTLSHANVQDLWELDTIGIRDPTESKTKEKRDLDALKQFSETVTRKEDGRYSVTLPWVHGVQNIPNNYSVAEKRLQFTTQKLLKDGVYEEYDGIFKAWEEEGIIQEVKDDSKLCHYLPHRHVLKPESQTTPVRPVFDASCKTGRNPSLNDCLEKGPNLLELIPSILMRFREKNVGVISDIRKAFQMIDVQDRDCDFLRFLWWTSSEEKTIKIYRHHRVVFGVNCSPFLLGAVINKHLDSAAPDQQRMAMQLKNSLYVDNCVTSVNSMAEYERFKLCSTNLLAEAKMELRQWEFGFVEEFGVGVNYSLDSQGLNSPQNQDTAVLGLKWNKRRDTLRCVITAAENLEKITKRILLSQIQKTFDPLGFLSPALLIPKLLMQECWTKKIGWDEELPDQIRVRYLDWMKNYGLLSDVEIRRQAGSIIVDAAPRSRQELHVFCDASTHAYAAVVFLREVNERGITVSILQSKTRLAPIKTVTIPRLELLACTVGARLAQSVIKAMRSDLPTFYWSDSTTALAWISRNNEWGTFVGNRVKEICQLSNPDDWRHVPGIYNPADLPSRGCDPVKFLESRWWEGPAWLKQSSDQWPSENMKYDEETIHVEERKSAAVAKLLNEVQNPWFTPFSTYQKNIHFIAWMTRFVKYLQKLQYHKGHLTGSEILDAEKKIWKLVQNDVFPKVSKFMHGVNVDLDGDGLLRVRTRLLNRSDMEDFKRPILLPKKHQLVEQLIISEHRINCHAGTQLLTGIIRERFWILQARRSIRSVIAKCVQYRRLKVKNLEVEPAALPEDRVKNAKVFEVIGVDLAGPLYLKDNNKCGSYCSPAQYIDACTWN
ncbi:uncharacterized protein LOC110861672 [Folsomia candida]|uniref:uncharacterized protein LOC110861672 n=1 Tax=Folsomia candida TaxID=158441 RepID=UPI000B901C0E|nr:uncharacterized protein LOC110861672 [Folsomia candida]